MKRYLVIPLMALAGALAVGRVAEAQKPPRLIEITAGDNMKYSTDKIEAKPGESLKVRLKSTGTMPKIAMGHNFVVLKPGVAPLDFANAGLSHRETDFIDPAMKDKTIAATTMIGPGESAEALFKAPAKPGSYDFLCTFPGHLAGGMKGALVVK